MLLSQMEGWMLTSLAWMNAVLELLVSLVIAELVFEVLHVPRMKLNLFSSIVLYCGRVPAANAPGCTTA